MALHQNLPHSSTRVLAWTVNLNSQAWVLSANAWGPGVQHVILVAEGVSFIPAGPLIASSRPTGARAHLGSDACEAPGSKITVGRLPGVPP